MLLRKSNVLPPFSGTKSSWAEACSAPVFSSRKQASSKSCATQTHHSLFNTDHIKVEKDSYDILERDVFSLAPTWRAAPGRSRNSLENRSHRKLKLLKISSETTAQLKGRQLQHAVAWRGSSGANSRF